MRETAVSRWGVSRETARDSARQRETARVSARDSRRKDQWDLNFQALPCHPAPTFDCKFSLLPVARSGHAVSDSSDLARGFIAA